MDNPRHRRGERLGWTLGWLGGFIWVAALSIVFMVQERWPAGMAGLLLVGIASIAIPAAAPWRHPTTPYWRLMLVPYGLFLAAIIWAVWSYGGLEAVGIQVWDLAWLLPLLIPIINQPHRTWSDGEPRNPAAPDRQPRP